MTQLWKLPQAWRRKESQIIAYMHFLILSPALKMKSQKVRMEREEEYLSKPCDALASPSTIGLPVINRVESLRSVISRFPYNYLLDSVGTSLSKSEVFEPFSGAGCITASCIPSFRADKYDNSRLNQ